MAVLSTAAHARGAAHEAYSIMKMRPCEEITVHPPLGAAIEAAVDTCPPHSEEQLGSGTRRTRLSLLQETILRALLRDSGCVLYRQLARAAYGLRSTDLAGWERAALGRSAYGLEHRGLVRLHRNWGNWRWGQPEVVELTDMGRQLAVRLVESSSPEGQPAAPAAPRT